MDQGEYPRTLPDYRRRPEGKVYKLLDFAGSDRDIADPWYTGNFDDTYNDIMEGLAGFCGRLGIPFRP